MTVHYDDRVFITDDQIEKSILSAYHLAKPWWWIHFWGWRSTKGSVCCFTIPNKHDFGELCELIEYAKGEKTK